MAGSNSTGGATAGAGGATAGAGGATAGAGGATAGAGGATAGAGGATAGAGGATAGAGGATAGAGGATAGAGGAAAGAGGATAGAGGVTAGAGGATAGAGGATAGAGGATAGAGGATAGAGGVGGQGGSSGSGGDVILQYKFNENAGTTAVDSTLNHLDGTLVGTAWAPGRNASGISLPAGAPQVTLPSGIVSTADEFTASAWVYLTANDQWARIFDFGTGTNNYMFLTANGGAGPRFGMKVNGAAEVGLGVNAAMPLNVWKHIAITVAASGANLYVDGHLVASNAALTSKPSDLGVTTNNWIGKSQFPDAPYAGSIDEFYLYRRALTATEIQALAWPKTDYTIYHFDEAAGTKVADSSDNARDGTLVGGPTFSPGRTGNALDLTGTVERYATLPTGIIQNCTSLTAAAWINMSANDQWNRVFDFGFNTDSYIFLTPHNGGNNLSFVIKPAGQPEQVVQGPGGFALSTWNHVAAVLDAGTAHLYLNGNELSSATFTANPTTIGATTNNYIGKSQWPDPNFRGLMDDFLISCRAYTPGEIKMLAQ